jgi:hypothetical protein
MPYRRVALAVLVVLCACQKNTPSPADPSPKTSAMGFAIEFMATVPKLDGELPVYELTGTATPRPEFIRHLPEKFRNKAQQSQAGFEVFPDLVQIAARGTFVPARHGEELKNAIARMSEAFGPEETWAAGDARILHFARAHRGAKDTTTYDPDQPKVLFTSLRRTVNGIAVDGPGSRFTTAVSADGQIVGAVYHWRGRAKKPEKSLRPRDEKEVKDEITKQLKGTRAVSPILVRKIELAYYDADQRFVQPVYRYVAEVTHASRVSKGRTSFYVGYVPFDSEIGEVPTELGGTSSEPTRVKAFPGFDVRTPTPPADAISIGRYVAYGANAGFLRDADAFWLTLTNTPGQFTFDPKYQHYFYAWRPMFTSRKEWFVNSVDLALIEAHGSPWTFTTYQDFGGATRLGTDVPVSGYGANAGGRLKHLILHSCRVIPVGGDQYHKHATSDWAHEWWDLFNGLSSVVGYRSSMFIDDGAGAALAGALASGHPVVPAWLSAVAALNIYGPDAWETTYCADPEPMGRAAAITVCNDGSVPERRQEGANATLTDPSTARPNCLEAWWLGDELVPADPVAPRLKVAYLRSDKDCPDEGDDHPPWPPYSDAK